MHPFKDNGHGRCADRMPRGHFPTCDQIEDNDVHHYDDCPTEAHTHEPWTDDDTAELAAAMSDAAWRIADRHSEARIGALFCRDSAARTSAGTPYFRLEPWNDAYWTAIRREDDVADRMGDDPQPLNLPIIRALIGNSWVG